MTASRCTACPSLAAWRGARPALPATARAPRGPPAPPGWLASALQPPGEPGTYRGVERAGVDGFQDPADGGLIRRLEPAGQRITAGPQAGPDLRRGVGD